MKVRLVSDIHTEFCGHMNDDKLRRYIELQIPSLPEDKETVLILSGDAGSMHKPHQLKVLIDVLAGRFQLVLYVPGNHEYYGGSLSDTGRIIREMCAPHKNVFFTENGRFQLDNKRTVWMATLWTDFNGGDDWAMQKAHSGMNDYNHIQNVAGVDMARPAHMLAMHKEALDKFKMMKKGDIVMTHHLPSYKSIPAIYQSGPYSYLNPAYASNLEVLICNWQPAIWFHGHTHTPCDYMIGNTRIVANPCGYLGEKEQGYNPKLVIEI